MATISSNKNSCHSPVDGKRHWDIRLLQTPSELTPAVVEAAADETIGDALTRARLDAVTRLLRQRHVPLAQIPARCGFANANSLRNLFRRTYGVSMRAWRDTGI